MNTDILVLVEVESRPAVHRTHLVGVARIRRYTLPHVLCVDEVGYLS